MRRRVCDDEGESENEKKTNVEKIRKRQILKINEKEIQIGKKVKNRKFRVLSSNSFNIKFLQPSFVSDQTLDIGLICLFSFLASTIMVFFDAFSSFFK